MLRARRAGTPQARPPASARVRTIVAGIQTPGAGMLIRITARIWANTMPSPRTERAAKREVGRRAAGNRPQDVPAGRAQRDTNTDLARATCHHERQQRVDADDRQRQRHSAHRRQAGGHSGEERAIVAAGVLERADILQLQIRIDIHYRHSQRRGQRQRIERRSQREIPQPFVTNRKVEAAGERGIANAQPQIGNDPEDLAPG